MKEEQNLTSEQRIAIIEQMIHTAKGNISDGSFHFLLWGWVVALANLGHYLAVVYTNYSHPELIWIICIPAAIISGIYGYKQGEKAIVSTYTDRISKWLWVGLFPCIIIIIFFGSKINFMINPIIMLFTGYVTFQSGIIIKFKPLVIGGIIFCIASIIGFLIPNENQALVSAVAVILGYLVPGYQLKSKHKNG